MEGFVIAGEYPSRRDFFPLDVSSLCLDGHSGLADVCDNAPPATEPSVAVRPESDFPSPVPSALCAAIRSPTTIVIFYDTLQQENAARADSKAAV
jgi:hypothetical protein